MGIITLFTQSKEGNFWKMSEKSSPLPLLPSGPTFLCLQPTLRGFIYCSLLCTEVWSRQLLQFFRLHGALACHDLGSVATGRKRVS